MAQTSSSATRSRPETARKRTEILQAAIETFGAKGSANGTLADIAEQVGMTHAGVLHHFGSKQKLLLEVLAYRDESDVQALVDRHIPGGPELFLHLVRTAHANALRPGIVQVYAVLSSESVTDGHPARSFFEQRFRVLRQDVRDAFLELCAQEGVTDRSTVDMACASILGAMDGLQLQWLLDPTAIDLGEATEFAITAIVNGVLHPGPPLASRIEPLG
ncbi:TetR/AcrR family transcriptional regulator [Protaetiibacter intestinalis]|uniref:TetR/AcrR family transcriptional regulator n=1 Tax=Protaetiibacter intestinalis TaxID=2419774 RepID=A0A387BCE0_9MICO|nr:TetR/AcrR family transcriptional regulator [Protaetiibacter intestinalis]AYF98765.1 TetR/AcrR family transcriptional regulator [Protaetiibacter intestinalis]